MGLPCHRRWPLLLHATSVRLGRITLRHFLGRGETPCATHVTIYHSLINDHHSVITFRKNARVVEWQTRTFEGRMPKGMRVQVPPRAPIPGSICSFAGELFDLASIAYGFRSLF